MMALKNNFERVTGFENGLCITCYFYKNPKNFYDYCIHFISSDYIELKVIAINFFDTEPERKFYFKNLYECFDKITQYEENF